jgi:predicted O-methyltransferase YrrM
MTPDFTALYRQYDAELRPLALKLRRKFHEMQHAGFRAVFGDVEGEVLYLLIRESKPKTVFEISPAAGYSTNYILAALTANGSGELHSFELDTAINGQPTGRVIRGNLIEGLDTRRFHLHLGDARDTTQAVAGPIDLCLMDSCHEEWFARWYVETIFPRVQGWVMTQDIAFHDRLETSGEAKFVWDWAAKARLPFQLVGKIELELEQAGVRRGFAERRAMECNSLIFQLPQSGEAGQPTLNRSPEDALREAEECIARNDRARADEVLSATMSLVLQNTRRTNRHRLLFRMGQLFARMEEPGQAARCFQLALGIVMGGEPAQRAKGLRELSRLCRKEGLGAFAFQVWVNKMVDRVFNARSWRIPK